MPHLATLRGEGFSIWPFREAQTPLVIEIYPRLITGPLKKADFDEREAYLTERCPEIDDTLAFKAASSEDAFDAAVSAVVMSRHLDEISTLTESRDDTYVFEGRIWWPREIREAAASPHISPRAAMIAQDFPVHMRGASPSCSPAEGSVRVLASLKHSPAYGGASMCAHAGIKTSEGAVSAVCAGQNLQKAKVPD